MVFEKNLNRGLTSLLITGNLLVLYYLIPMDFILKTTWGMFWFSVFLILTGVIFKKERLRYLNPKRIFTSSKHSFGITKETIKVNKKYLFLAVITLTIAVASISQAVIISEGVQRQYVIQNTDKFNLPTLVVKTYSPPSLPPEKVYYRKVTPQVADRIDEMVKAYSKNIGLHTHVSKEYRIAILSTLYTKDNYGTYPSAIVGMSKELMEQLWGKDYQGFYPKDNVSVFAIVFPYELGEQQPKWFLGKSINVQSQWKNRYGNYDKMYGFWNVSGFKIINSVEVTSEIPFGIGDVPPILYIVPFENIDSYRKVYDDTVSSYLYNSYYYDWQNEPDIITFSRKIHLLANDLILNSNDLEGPYPEYQLLNAKSPIYEQLLTLGEIITKVRTILMFFLIPIVIVGIFLAIFALNLAERKRKEIIGVFKTRGVSSQQLKGSMTIETLITGFLSYLLGIVLSAILLVSFKWFSKVSLVQYAIPALTSPKLLVSSFIFSIILALDITWNRIHYLSEIKVEETENQEKISNPFWRKYFLDIFLLILGLLGLVGLRYLSNLNSPYVQTDIFILIFSPLVLLLLFLGGTMTFYRIFVPIAYWFSKFLYNVIGSIAGMGLRGIRLRRESSSQVAAIVMLSSLFALTLVVAPPSINQVYNDQLHYKVGADIRISSLSTQWNGTDYSFLNKTKDISSFAGGVLVEVKIRDSDGENIIYRILGIDLNTYFDTAFYRNDFAPESITKIKQYLSENKTNALIWSKDKQRLLPGEKVNFTAVSKISYSDFYNFTFNTDYVFNYWPIVLKEEYTNTGYRLVTNIQRALEIYKSIRTFYINEFDLFVLVKTNPGADIDKLSQTLRIEASVYGDPVVYSTNSVGMDSEDVALKLSMPYMSRMGLVVLMTIVFVSLILYGVANVNVRKSEISLLKTLGMVKSQLSRLFASEMFYVVFMSSLTGYFLGVIINPISLDLITSSGFFDGYPPMLPMINVLLEQIFYGGIFVITILTSLVPVFLVARLKPGEIFRNE